MGTWDRADSGHCLNALVSWSLGTGELNVGSSEGWPMTRSPAHQAAGQSWNPGPGDSGTREAIA